LGQLGVAIRRSESQTDFSDSRLGETQTHLSVRYNSVSMPRVPTTTIVRKRIQQLERHLNNLKMVPAIRLCRNAVILPLLSKALTVSRAICVLIDAGFPAEAFAMSRTLIEIYFCLRYISNKDTEARAQTYVKYHAKVRQEWQSVLLKYYPHSRLHKAKLDERVLETAKEFKSKAHWTGHGGQARLMALEPDEFEKDEQGEATKDEFDYDALYFWTSQFVHATVEGTDGHAIEAGEVFKVRARSWADKPYGVNALLNTVVFLCKIFVVACRAMNEEQPPFLRDMYEMIGGFARKTIQ
jgi:hypothetical protein